MAGLDLRWNVGIGFQKPLPTLPKGKGLAKFAMTAKSNKKASLKLISNAFFIFIQLKTVN